MLDALELESLDGGLGGFEDRGGLVEVLAGGRGGPRQHKIGEGRLFLELEWGRGLQKR